MGGGGGDLAVKSQGPPSVIISLIPIAHEYPRLHINFLFPQALEAPDDFWLLLAQWLLGGGEGGGGCAARNRQNMRVLGQRSRNDLKFLYSQVFMHSFRQLYILF